MLIQFGGRVAGQASPPLGNDYLREMYLMACQRALPLASLSSPSLTATYQIAFANDLKLNGIKSDTIKLSGHTP